MIFQNIHMNSFASPLHVLYLIIKHFLFSIRQLESLLDFLIMFFEQMNVF